VCGAALACKQPSAWSTYGGNFCICEPLHTAEAFPGANFPEAYIVEAYIVEAYIVIVMKLGRTTTMRKMILTLLSGRNLAAAAVLASAVAVAAPTPAEARVSTGAAVGIGLGSFALGTALGSGAFAHPYGYYPYGYYAPAPTYYAPPVQPRTCWYPQHGGYYAC
jgi:hypothetical protein